MLQGPVPHMGITVELALDVEAAGELSSPQEGQPRRSSPIFGLLSGSLEEGEMSSFPPLSLAIYGKWETWSQGHESGRTDHFSHQLQPSGRWTLYLSWATVWSWLWLGGGKGCW